MPLHTHRHTNRPLNYILCDYGVYNIGPVGIISVSKACHFLSCFFSMYSHLPLAWVLNHGIHMYLSSSLKNLCYILYIQYIFVFPCICFHFLFIMGITDVSLFKKTTQVIGPGRSRETSDRGLGESQQPGGPWRLFEVFGGPAVMLFSSNLANYGENTNFVNTNLVNMDFF